MLDTLTGDPPASQLKFRSTSEDLPRVQRPTWAELSRGFIKPQRPVVIEGLIDEWPALELWTPAYFDRLLLGGRRRADDAPGRNALPIYMY